MIRLLIIIGSPRIAGNSAALAQLSKAVADTSTNPIVSTAIVSVAAVRFGGCTGCNGCSATGICTVRDGMREIYSEIDLADAILWIAPVYFGSVPGQLKALIDRFQAYWVRRQLREALGRPKPYHDRRPASLVLVRGGGDPFGHEGAVTPVTAASNLAEFRLREPIVILGPDGPGDVASAPFDADRAAVEAEVRTLIDEAARWVEQEEAETDTPYGSPSGAPSAGDPRAETQS